MWWIWTAREGVGLNWSSGARDGDCNPLIRRYFLLGRFWAASMSASVSPFPWIRTSWSDLNSCRLLIRAGFLAFSGVGACSSTIIGEGWGRLFCRWWVVWWWFRHFWVVNFYLGYVDRLLQNISSLGIKYVGSRPPLLRSAWIGHLSISMLLVIIHLQQFSAAEL